MPERGEQTESMRRLAELIARLDEVQREIRSLTDDGVDAVLLPDGLPFLLSGAQDALRAHGEQQHANAARLSAILDALPAKVVLLDADGGIVATNASWREKRLDEASSPVAEVGENYLESCDRAEGDGARDARASADGIRDVLAGNRDEFSMDYPCHTPDGETRWFRLLVAPLPASNGRQAVVMHIDVTLERRAEAHARREQQYFRQLFDGSPMPMWVFDRETLRFLEVNRAAIEHYGYPRERFLEMTIRDIRPRGEVERLDRYLAGVSPEGRRTGAWRHLRADGTEIDVEIASDELELDGRDARLVVATDISERLRARRISEIESATFAAISNRGPVDRIMDMIADGLEYALPDTVVSIILLTPGGGHVAHVAAPSLSGSFRRALGAMKVGPEAGMCGAEIHAGASRVVSDLREDAAFREFAGFADEMGLRACWSLPIHDSGKRVVGSLAAYHRKPRRPEAWERELGQRLADVAGLAIERQRQDEALAISERRLRKLFRDAATGIVVVSATGDFEQANGVFATFLDCPEDRLATLNYHQVTHPDDRAAVRSAMRRLLSGDTHAETLEQRFIRPGGDEVWGRVRLSAQSGRDGRPDRLIGVVEDTTLRKRAEMQLERASALQRIAGRIGRVGGWSLDLERDEVFWSPEIFDILEWGDGDVPPLSNTLELYPPEHRDRVQEAIRRGYEKAVPFDMEAEVETRGGHRLQVRVAGEPEFGPDGQVVRLIGVFQDITSQKRTEARHAELSKRLESVLENMSDAFLLLDADWNITYINRAGEELVASTRDELLDRNIWEAFPAARDTIVWQEYHHAVESGSSAHFEFFYAPLEHWLEISAYPSMEGLAIYFRVTTEKRELEAQLRQAQRMESIGQLTGGIAHDFNNLLTVILGNSEVLAESLEDSEDLAPVARTIGDAAMRGAELTRRLLAFARRQPLAPEPVDVGRLIRDLEHLLRRALGEQCEMEISHGAGLWPAMIDSSQFESALMNLAINARDAMPGGGRLTMEAANVRIDDEYTTHHPDVDPGQYVLVAVSDTGIGIPKEHLDKVVEPFFTTKAKGGGTGLGLSMVYGFIKQSRGHIRIYSERGEGTTVRLYLPRAELAAAKPRVTAMRSAAGRGEAVLIVEDEPSVRQFAGDVLAQLGYTVRRAAGGREALQLLEQGIDCDLLFTDVVMPGGMSGPELARAAQDLRPGLKVLYTSGYTENAIVHQGRLDPGVQLLSKPYRRDELALRVRRMLDQPRDDGGGRDGR